MRCTALHSKDLISQYNSEWGSTEIAQTDGLGELAYETFVAVEPSPSGLELFGWAQGRSDVVANLFTNKAQGFDVEPPLPRLESVSFPRLTTATSNAEGGPS